MDMVPEADRKSVVKDFIKRFAWKGPVFEISALTTAARRNWSTPSIVPGNQKHSEQRAEETQMTEEARGISSIDPDDPRFKILD